MSTLSNQLTKEEIKYDGSPYLIAMISERAKAATIKILPADG